MLLQWPDRRPIIQETTFANGIDFSPKNLHRCPNPVQFAHPKKARSNTVPRC